METLRSTLVFAALLTCYFSGIITGADIPKEIDMFREVGLLDKVFTGVTKGSYNNRVSFHFTTSASDLIAKKAAFEKANKMIHESHDFRVTAYAKLDTNAKYADNTIVSISSKDGQRLYFMLSLSGDQRGSQLKIGFSFLTKGNPKTITTICPRGVLYNTWHKIEVRVQDGEKLLRIYADNKMIAVHRFDYTLPVIPSDSELRLAQVFEVLTEGVGEIQNKFRGDLQDVKFELGASNDDCKDTPRPCKCLPSGKKGCLMDGTHYGEGEKWNSDQCNNCQCKDGQVICIHTCPVCKDANKTYLHGDTWNNNCLECKCESGKKVCSPPPCPKLDCSGKSGQTLTLPGQCCPICKEDQCKGTDRVYKTCGSACPTTCENFHNKALCQDSKCKEGCFCAKDKVLRNGACVAPALCQCTYNGKKIKPGQYHFPTPCDLCICIFGQLHCSNLCK